MAMIARGKTLVGAYAIAGGKEGKERLDLLSDAMRATTLELLESAGLKRGAGCLPTHGPGLGNSLSLRQVALWPERALRVFAANQMMSHFPASL
jgi:hypothetical protein